MSDGERHKYLQEHRGEITYLWVQSAKQENDRRGWSDPIQARIAAQSLIKAAQYQEDPSILALAHWALGNAYLFEERPQKAVEHFERAAALYRKVGRELDVARMGGSYVWALTQLGSPEQALQVAAEIAPVLERSPERQDRKSLFTLDSNAGIALEFRGDYEAALLTYRRVQRIVPEVWEAEEAEIQTARIEQNCALVLTKLNRFAEAEEAYHKAREVLEKHAVVADVVRVFIGEGWLYDRMGRAETARESFVGARVWLDRLSDEESLQVADLTLYALRGQLKYSPDVVVAKAAHLRQLYAGRAFVYQQEAALLEARARLRKGDFEGARRVATEVQQMLSGRSLPDLLWRSHYLLGRAWEKEDVSKADEHYSSAMEIIERDQRRIADVELRASALISKLDVYRDLASLLVRGRDYEAALEVIERSKAQIVVDALQERARTIPIPQREEGEAVRQLYRDLEELRTELDRYYREQGLGTNDALRSASTEAESDLSRLEATYTEKARELSHQAPYYGTVLGTYVASLSEIRELLSPDTLFVEYSTTTDGQLFVLLVTDSDIRYQPLHALEDVEELTEALPHRSLTSPDEDVWRRLYELLVAPWAVALEGVRRLIVVPDGPLHYVPFQALCATETGRYLLQDYEISYAPSATLLVLSSRMQPRRRDTILALGYDGGQLLHVPAEMQAIAGIFSTLTMFTGAQASRKHLEDLAPDAEVIHIAAHGDFRSDTPLFSFVALADGRWQVTDIYRQRINASLVTLGACWTGRGELTGSDLLGFTHALFYAGAQSALVSLWPVHDASTAVMMSVFYRGLWQGLRKTAALRQAQLALLNSSRWSDPIYWASFCLVGSDGIVGAGGMLRAVQRIVNSGRLPLQASERLLEQVEQISAHDSADPPNLVEQVTAMVESSPELQSLLRKTSIETADLSQVAREVEQAAEAIVAWRWYTGEEMEEAKEGERSLGAATTDKRPVPNETVVVKRSEMWRWLSSEEMAEVAEGGRPLGRTTSIFQAVPNETVEELERLRCRLLRAVKHVKDARGG
jgi:CHAT domain-containing protein/Flp pilus assembly protein TadD